MKKTLFVIPFLLLFTFNGCKLKDKAKTEYEKLKNKYEEITNKVPRGKRPFPVVFQKEEYARTTIISSQCTENEIPKYIYFATQDEANNHIFTTIRNLYSFPIQGILKPFWDVRYTNPVTQYINGNNGSHFPNHSMFTGIDTRKGLQNQTIGTDASQVDTSASVVQTKCVDGKLAAGTILNLNDAPEQDLLYAGPHSTFVYNIHASNHIAPWKQNKTGNLMMEAYFDTPIYINFEKNIGASLSFAIYLYNKRNHQQLSYVIAIYASGEAWQHEKAGIRFDPTTNIIHVATVIKDTSWWCTKSPKSKSIIEILNSPTKTTKDDGKWKHFYRVNIAYNNLLEVLKELKRNPPTEVANKDFGLRPQDWEVRFLAIQYELEEQGGKALYSGSFRGFEAYMSNNPL